MMKQWIVLSGLAIGCGGHAEPDVKAPTGSAAIVASDAGSGAAAPAMPTALGVATHFKTGARGQVADVTFELQMLPKLIVDGPEPEIEQLQITASRGAEHGRLLVTTRAKRATWGGLTFELGYADVYHDDIELTITRAAP
jgi:hypothetical protein